MYKPARQVSRLLTNLQELIMPRTNKWIAVRLTASPWLAQQQIALLALAGNVVRYPSVWEIKIFGLFQEVMSSSQADLTHCCLLIP